MNKNEVLEKLKSTELDAFFVSKIENVRYLSDFTGDDSYFIIKDDGACYFITDSRYTYQALIEVKDANVVEYKGKDFLDKIGDIFGKSKSIGIESVISLSLYTKLKERFQNIQFVPQNSFFEELRMIKTKNEISIIEEASNIASKAYLRTIQSLKQGMTELELSAILEFEMKKAKAKKVSFDTIVASGERSAMPHGIASEKIIEKGDIVTIDFGCFYKCYASDATRTISFGKPKNSKANEIYNIVLDAQLEALSKIKEGVKTGEIDEAARNIIKKAGYGDNFGHSTGHGVGLEIHEMPSISPDSDIILKEGMTITVEPGIYIDSEFGVRIEDLVVVQKKGFKNLTSLDKEVLLEL